jgi:hypothetical protein
MVTTSTGMPRSIEQFLRTRELAASRHSTMLMCSRTESSSRLTWCWTSLAFDDAYRYHKSTSVVRAGTAPVNCSMHLRHGKIAAALAGSCSTGARRA